MGPDTSRQVLQTVGNYDLLEKIAEGGMGTVYKSRDRTTGQIVAIKLVSPQMATNPTLLKRFENEFNAARKLDHPNIIRALDYGSAGGRPYLVMEFVDGESLGQRLEREGKFPEDEAIRLISQTALGLEGAHKQGIIHRDVKPDNIMVTADGQVKLADLGLVKELETDLNLTRTGRGLGTPHFMAPEQFRNAKNADERCDIYSLAATLYMMVTGKMPFAALGPLDAWMKKVNNELTPPRKVVSTLSARVDEVIRRAMHSDPDQRPRSCQEFLEELTGKTPRKIAAPTAETRPQELWYLLYKDEEDVPHMVKGTVIGIRRSLKEGLLGDASNIRASRTKTGGFKLLKSYPEFRDLVSSAARGSAPTPVNLPAAATDPTPPAPSPPGGIPHIRLKATGAKTREWVQLFLWLTVAVLVGVIVALLIQK